MLLRLGENSPLGKEICTSTRALAAPLKLREAKYTL
jgi:hypothetical protein